MIQHCPAPRCWQGCLGLIQKLTNDILYIKLSVSRYTIWTQQRINSKIKHKRTWKVSQNYLENFQKIHRVQNCLYACKLRCKCIFQYQCSASYHWIFTEITYMCTLNKYAKPCEWIESESRHMLYKIDLSALICHFFEKSMIARAALVLKDAFAPLFASIHTILDSVEFLENFEVILANFSSSCFYVLSLSKFFVVFIFYYVRLIVWCIKCHKSVFVWNPDRLVNNWELGNVGSYTKPLTESILTLYKITWLSIHFRVFFFYSAYIFSFCSCFCYSHNRFYFLMDLLTVQILHEDYHLLFVVYCWLICRYYSIFDWHYLHIH